MAVRLGDSTLSAVRLITISAKDAGQRLDNYLFRVLKGVPKTRIYRIIRKGEVRVNKKRARALYRLQEEDCIRIPPIRLSEQEGKSRVPLTVSSRLLDAIVYEDDALIIINKSSGIAVHGGSGISYGVIEALRQLRGEDKNLELVHRLDRETSGCLMIAKKRSMLRYIHEQLQKREGVDKIYHALVQGRWPSTRLLVKAPLQKNTLRSGERMVQVHVDGKPAKTAYQVLERLRGATLIKASPLTGRTHQIRVHCLHAGHAIIGDHKYGSDIVNQQFKREGVKRLFLHAASLRLTLPSGKVIKVDAPLPDDLQAALKQLRFSS
ncbi:MAG: 23S rRNA pseudouridine(955/2504/2580) synthase RluC [Endozoicomonas sp. (ex Botrylloides leachii)]|nr:23S rRNA pseudouridine(955/2504/2580) synthase RluC [Endozoicomonas sp. (ex Botrylloides leachii)]